MTIGTVAQARRKQVLQVLTEAQRPLTLQAVAEEMRIRKFENYSFWIKDEISGYAYQLKREGKIKAYGTTGRRLYKAVMSNREEK